MEVATNFCLLHAKLSKLGFGEWDTVSEGDVMTGNPHTFAVFLRFLYRRFPTATASLLRQYDWFLIEAEDTALGTMTLRLLSAATVEVSGISALQFAQSKFAMAKINMCHALLRLLRSLTASLRPSAAPRRKAIDCSMETAAMPPSIGGAAVHLRIAERRRALNSAPRS